MFDEFDLYNVVHKSVENDPNIKKKPISPPRKRSPVGKKSTLLTAKSLDSHFTNGKHDWCLVDCGCDLYRTLIKTANDVNEKPRLENAERVFFDLQPLSTRLALMTKFIVIAQGGTAFSPASYITVYPGSASSPTSTTSRSKSFDSSLLSPRSAASMYASPSRGVVMANSGLYVKIWANDGVKMSVFGTDPSTRLSRIQSCRLVPTAPRTIKPGRSVKISELMSNFEPRHKSDDRLNESKTIISENSHSESSLTNVGGEEGEYTSANMISNNSSNKTILTKSYSENNPRVLNTGVRIAETTTTTSSMATTTTTTTTRRKTHEEHQLPINTTTTSTMTMTNNIDDPKTMLLPQRIQIPIRIEDPILSGTTNVLSDGTIRPAKTEVFTYSYQRKVLQPQPPSVKARTGSVEATRNNKRVEVRFDDSWEKTNEHNGGNAANQKRLLKSSEWTLTKQNSTGKKDC